MGVNTQEWLGTCYFAQNIARFINTCDSLWDAEELDYGGKPFIIDDSSIRL